MKIHVKLITGESFELDDVDEKASVCDLKQSIALHRGEDNAPVERQRLIVRGREIKENELLSSCGVIDGSVVHLVVRPIFVPPAASSPAARIGNYANFTTVDLGRTPQAHSSAGTIQQANQIRKVFDLGTRMCMLTVIDGISLWMMILLYNPIWAPLCFFVATGYYGAAHYSVVLLSAYAAFLTTLCAASAYILMAQLGTFAYIGIFSLVWHLYIVFQVQRLIVNINMLSLGDRELLRSVDSTPITDTSRRTSEESRTRRFWGRIY